MTNTERVGIVTGAGSGLGEAAAKRLVAQTVTTYGRLDLAFNNAGITPRLARVGEEAMVSGAAGRSGRSVSVGRRD